MGTSDANSAQHRAAKIEATPARTNESTTAGPEFTAATVPVSTKIPVPMIAPMPRVVRLSALNARFKLLSVSASFWRSETLFRRKRLMRAPWERKDGQRYAGPTVGAD